MVHGTLLPRTLVITCFEASCKSINNCGGDPRTVDGGAQPPPPRIETKRTRENRASARTANESHVMRDKPQTALPRIETDVEERSPSIRFLFPVFNPIRTMKFKKQHTSWSSSWSTFASTRYINGWKDVS